MKSKLILVAGIILAVLMVSAVSAADTISDDNTLEITQNYIHTTVKAGSFSELEGEINGSGNNLEITKDYTFNNETDKIDGILIKKDNLTINGILKQ